MISIAICGKGDEKIMRNVPTRAPYYKLRCLLPQIDSRTLLGLLSVCVLQLVDECEHENLNLSVTFQNTLLEFSEKQSGIIERDKCIPFVCTFHKM